MAKAMRQLGRIWKNRTHYARRACVAACIAGTVVSTVPLNLRAFGDDSPELLMPSAVVHAVDEQVNSRDRKVLQVADKSGSPLRTVPSRGGLFTKISGEVKPASQAQQSHVAPAAGLLDGWFAGKPKVAKKESEDGRKATALPPPDPSVVDWNGVPFHQPRRNESKEGSESASAQPIRDTIRGAFSPVPSSTANLRRPATPTSTPSKPISATNRSTSPSLPPLLPPSRSVPRPPDSYDETLSQKAPGQVRPSTPDISGSTSSRRSGRRPVDPLNTESFVDSPNDFTEVPTEPVFMTAEPTPAPTVQRREMQPVDAVPILPKANRANELLGEIPSLPPAPPKQSLVESWKSVGSGLGEPMPVSSKSVPTTPTTPSVAALPPVPTSPAPSIPSDIAADERATGPSSESEQILRDRLTHEQAPVPLKPEPAKPEIAKPEPVKPEPVKPEPVKPEPVKPEPAQAEPAKPEPAQAESSSKATSGLEATRQSPSNKVLAASEAPGIRVVTEGPSEIMIRELTQYEIRVENRGAMDAMGIIVRSSLPGWAEVQGQNASVGAIKAVDQSGSPQLQWTIDKLPAGVVERMFVRVKAVRSGTFDVATDWTIVPQKHVAKVTVREPKLAIVIDGPDEIVFGQSEKYRVRVMNPGDGDATNVVFVLAPDSPSPQSQNIGNIPAGKESQFEIELTARELGELNIGGSATADREVKTVATKSIQIAAAVLEAELTGPPLKYQNTEATYHLFITNTGKAVCQTMNAELRLPTGAKYVSGIQEAAVQGDRLAWKIDSMQPGAVREYDVNIQLDRTGDMVIGFNCVGSAAGQASVSIETRVEAIADLVLSISDPAAPAPVNSDVAYEISILNRGSKAAEDVRIVAQFSDGIEPIKIEGQAGEVLTGQAMFSPIARIEPGSTVRLKVIANANRPGDHRFRAEVRHGETSLVAEEATMFMSVPAERISRRSTGSK